MAEQIRARIVAADDDVENLKFVEEALKAEGHHVHICNDGESAMHLLKSWMPHLMLLNINMPKVSALDCLKKVRETAGQEYVGVILVTGNSDSDEIVKGLDMGADDYIAKPFRMTELMARVRMCLRVKALHDSLRRANKRLEEAATLDDLTSLRNMRFMMRKMVEEVAIAKKRMSHLSCILFDMDNFKLVNDMHDHLFGSHVLTEVAQVIRRSLRRTDIAARYGGDEYFIALPGTAVKEAVEVAERMRKSIEDHIFRADNHSVKVTASFGVAGTEGPEDFARLDVRELMRSADSALYDAKRGGRNRIELYSSFNGRPVESPVSRGSKS